MNLDQRFERLIPPVVGPEPTVPLSSVPLKDLGVVSANEAFAEADVKIAAAEGRALIDRTIAEFTQDLSPREKRVLQMRLGIKRGPMSLRGIAVETGIPKSTVYDIEKRAIGKLKRPGVRIG